MSSTRRTVFELVGCTALAGVLLAGVLWRAWCGAQQDGFASAGDASSGLSSVGLLPGVCGVHRMCVQAVVCSSEQLCWEQPASSALVVC